MSKVLVVAEKPSVAMDIAKVLNCHNKSNGYVENDKYIITWAIGHLAGLKDPSEYNQIWSKWSFQDLPIIPEEFQIKVLERTKEQFNVIKKLINRSDIEYLINAGDAGREGLLIQNWIYRLAGNKKPVKLLWISSYTDDSIRNGFKNLKDNKEFLQLQDAAESRAIIDWIIGMNYSRAYSIKKAENKITLSIGRCQTPILNLIVKRDQEIDKFQPVPYYQIQVVFIKDNQSFKGIYSEDGKRAADINSFDAANNILSNLNKAEVLELREETKKISAPLLYDLTTLQQVMDNKYGYSASQTLNIAQALYEKHKILSYPRTSSRYLSTDIQSEIKRHLNCVNFGDFSPLVEGISYRKNMKAYFNDKKVTDHHALIPNLNSNMKNIYFELSREEKNVFDEVVLSLVAIFYPDYEYKSTTLISQSGDKLFLSRGKVELEPGWRRVRQDKGQEVDSDDESVLPVLKEGDNLNIETSKVLSKITRPPNRYTEASILGEMKKYGVGTQATRNEIINKLLVRKYCVKNEKKISSTSLGRQLIDSIDFNVKSIELTAELENKLEAIEEGKLSRDMVLNDVCVNLKKNINNIGLSESKIDIDDKSEKLICPLCKTGHIFKNSKAYSCSNWRNGCKFTIWSQVAGKKLTDNLIKQLLTKGKTGYLKGFTSTKGKKFDAYLIYKDGKLDFEFKD